jgi:hypothetical protein
MDAHHGPVVKMEADDGTRIKVEGNFDSGELKIKMEDEPDDGNESDSDIEMNDPENDEPESEQN